MQLERSIEKNWGALDRWIEWTRNFVGGLKVYGDTFPHACSMPVVASLRWAEIIAPIGPFGTVVFVHCYDGVVAVKTHPRRVWWTHIARRSHRATFFHPIGTSNGCGWDVWLGFLEHPSVSSLFSLFSFLFHLYVCVCRSFCPCSWVGWLVQWGCVGWKDVVRVSIHTSSVHTCAWSETTGPLGSDRCPVGCGSRSTAERRRVGARAPSIRSRGAPSAEAARSTEANS